MVLDLVFDGFSCISMVYILLNPKIMFIGFLKILGENGQKWVPKLKIAISQKHILIIT